MDIMGKTKNSENFLLFSGPGVILKHQQMVILVFQYQLQDQNIYRFKLNTSKILPQLF